MKTCTQFAVHLICLWNQFEARNCQSLIYIAFEHGNLNIEYVIVFLPGNIYICTKFIQWLEFSVWAMPL